MEKRMSASVVTTREESDKLADILTSRLSRSVVLPLLEAMIEASSNHYSSLQSIYDAVCRQEG